MKTRFIQQLIQSAALLFSSCALTLALGAKTHLKIAAAEEVIDDFKAWTAITPWEKITHFQNPRATRPVIDLLLQLHALKAGGLDFDFTLTSCLNHDQAKATVLENKADLSAETIWSNEIDANQLLLDRTSPIIRVGEFNKGIYVLPSNKTLLAISSIEELQKYRAAVVETWHIDGQTLQLMKISRIEKSPTKKKIGPLLQKKRADFVLMEFSSAPDMGIELDGVKLIPIPGCKVPLSIGRAWVVHKLNPHRTQLITAFDQGIAALRAAGTIEKAYSQSGFFHPEIRLWRQIF